MIADTFGTRASGKNAKNAFENAVMDAKYRFGNAGHTGTIAEKSSFIEIPADEVGDTDPEEYADQLIREEEPRISDKWGPAGCIPLGDNLYPFFGWANA